jgi:outer membrane protein assembly factor BamB
VNRLGDAAPGFSGSGNDDLISENESLDMKKLVILAVIGIFLLGLLYKFRHRIEHFHPHIRFRTLEAIKISPSTSSLARGSRKKFHAMAHYRDGGQAELVSEVTWTSLNPGIATIDAEGIVTAVNEGTLSVQASFQRETTTASVTVVPTTAVALAISPMEGIIALNGNLQLKVLATSSDDSVSDVTGQVNWTSSDPAVVKLTPSGMAHGQLQGSSTIVAELMTSLGNIQTATRLNVLSTTDHLAGVYSYRYDQTGTGQNRLETLLTPKNVQAATFGKLFATPLDGYVYAQPLYVSNVAVPGHGTRNVVYTATENNTVFAIDADSGDELFRTNLGPAVPEDQLVCRDMGPQVGITGTPVIDPATHTLFTAAKTFKNGSSFFHLHAIDIASGREKDGSPVLITATLPGNGAGSRNGAVTFDATPQLQRPGLELVNDQVVIAFGSFCDRGAFHGWVFGFDAASLKRTSVFLTTPDGDHGGIWQAGGAPVADPQGGLYVITGDGDFDAYSGGADYGDTFLRLQFTANNAIVPADYFTPFDQNEMGVENLDLGSSGPLVMPDQLGRQSHLLFGAGKNGAMYVVDRDDMGRFQSSNNDQIVQYLPHVFSSKVHTSPAYWRNSTSEWVYVSTVDGPLQAFSLSRGRLSPTASSQTPTVFGYPGATPVISSNGNSDGIVWALENSTGVLHAFAASDLSIELYNAQQAQNGRDVAEHGVQFYVPMVANGKVFFCTRGHLYAYGLLH